jgi:hypothetical protein
MSTAKKAAKRNSKPKAIKRAITPTTTTKAPEQGYGGRLVSHGLFGRHKAAPASGTIWKLS